MTYQCVSNHRVVLRAKVVPRHRYLGTSRSKAALLRRARRARNSQLATESKDKKRCSKSEKQISEGTPITAGSTHITRFRLLDTATRSTWDFAPCA